MLNPIPEIETYPRSEENMLEWVSYINGPDNSVYEDGVFEFQLTFPHEYPFKPPECKFKTRIYHCNVNSQGNVCLDILQVTNFKYKQLLVVTNIIPFFIIFAIWTFHYGTFHRRISIMATIIGNTLF